MKKKNSFTFASVPKVNLNRSRFDMSFGHKTSMNQGELTPFYLQEVYPGDSFKGNSTFVVRSASNFIRPIMDNLMLDTYYFYIPSRLLYEKFGQIFGENNNGYWAETEFAEAPKNGPSDLTSIYNNLVGGVADHLGLPINTFGKVPFGTFNVLPFRAFAKVYNDWFRDENTIAPMNIRLGENTPTNYGLEYINSSDWSVNNYFGKLPKVAKRHDYFTSCLPSPQKGEPVTFNIGSGFAPVITNNGIDNTSLLNEYNSPGIQFASRTADAAAYSFFSGNTSLGTRDGVLASSASLSSFNPITISPTNLGAIVSDLDSISVNDLRFAFQLQKMLERDARGGTRYTEYIQSHFNVLNPDSRLQRSEYLGGFSSPLNVNQVVQTTGSNQIASENSLGDLGAYSLTACNSGFKKSFTEHGFIIGCAVIRQLHSYQQGLSKMWFRFARTDYYDPIFANIGEQPVYSKEIYASNVNIVGNNVFGYNEAWADLRYNNSLITGFMRSGIDNSYDVWHLGDYYNSSPVLSKSFIEETDQVKEVLSVQEGPNFLVDIYNKIDAIRPMPLYSVPGLIDHN